MNLLPGPHDTGTAISLLLWRPDEWRLLPLIWEQNVPGSGAPHTRPFHADAVDAAALDLTLAELYRDGWQLQGQLTLTYTGCETTADFWRPLHARLWQRTASPGYANERQP